jgi:hypothetical protein
MRGVTKGMALTSGNGSVAVGGRDRDRLTRSQLAWESRSKNHPVLPLKYSVCMPKRPRPDPADEEEDSFSEVPSDDDQEPDISAALTGQKKRRISGSKAHILEESEDDDEDLQEIIRHATAKRDVKEGTQVVKKTKGKTKITKGEVGGGSFQSMGEYDRLACTFPPGLRPSA